MQRAFASMQAKGITRSRSRYLAFAIGIFGCAAPGIADRAGRAQSAYDGRAPTESQIEEARAWAERVLNDVSQWFQRRYPDLLKK